MSRVDSQGSSEKLFWNGARLRRLAHVLLIALVVAVTATVSGIQGVPSSSSILRGDFPAFYSAAEIVLHGEGKRLYDPALQASVQNRHWPDLSGRYLAFAYPPFVAALLAPLAKLPAHMAKAFVTVLGFASLVLTLIAVRPLLLQKISSITLLAAALAFGPIFSGVVSGQNVSLSMLLFACALRTAALNSRKGDLFCGIAIGVWMFKPHFALFALAALLLQRRFLVLPGVVIVGAIYGALATAVSGGDWLWQWLAAAREFAHLDGAANGHQMVSLIGVGEAIARHFASSGSGGGGASQVSSVISLGSWILSLSIGLSLVFTLLRIAAGRSGLEREKSVVNELKSRGIADTVRLTGGIYPLLLAGPAAVLLSPHTLYYDLGLAFVSVAIAVSSALNSDRKRGLTIAALLLSFVLGFTRDLYSVSPFVLFSIAAYVVVTRFVQRDSDFRSAASK